MSQISEIIQKYLPALRVPGIDTEHGTPEFVAAVQAAVEELKALPADVLRKELELQTSMLGILALSASFGQHVITTIIGENPETHIHPDSMGGSMIMALADGAMGADTTPYTVPVHTDTLVAEGTREGKAPFPAGGVPDPIPVAAELSRMGAIAAPSND